MFRKSAPSESSADMEIKRNFLDVIWKMFDAFAESELKPAPGVRA